MSKNKKISASMSAENKQVVLRNLSSLEGALQNALTCNHSLVSPINFERMNYRSLAFVNRALIYAMEKPVLVLPHLNVINARKNFRLATDLAEIHSRLNYLLNGIKNTINVANAEAYETALVYYKIRKESSLVYNKEVDPIINDLSNYLHSSSKKHIYNIHT